MQLVRREHQKWCALGLGLLIALLVFSEQFRSSLHIGRLGWRAYTVALCFIFLPPMIATLVEALRQKPPSQRR